MSNRKIATNGGVSISPALLRQMAVNIRGVYRQPLAPEFDGRHVPDRICAVNDSMLVQSYFSEGLTNYAVGWAAEPGLEQALEFVAPMVPVSRRFEYAYASNIEGFFSELLDDERPMRGDFKNVEYTEGKTLGKTVNRGLMLTVDMDEVADKKNWQKVAVAKLLARLRRNSLRRATALISAAAVNTAKTWDATAGKDPDQDVITELTAGGDLSGVNANRVLYGQTAWNKRGLSHRAQNTAGGFASAQLTPDQLAGVLGVDGVFVAQNRYQSSATAKSQIVGAKVIMFMAQQGASEEDPSNIKRFVSPCEGGGYYKVYVWQIGAKTWGVAVEHYESTMITSTLGIRQFTIA